MVGGISVADMEAANIVRKGGVVLLVSQKWWGVRDFEN